MGVRVCEAMSERVFVYECMCDNGMVPSRNEIPFLINVFCESDKGERTAANQKEPKYPQQNNQDIIQK